MPCHAVSCHVAKLSCHSMPCRRGRDVYFRLETTGLLQPCGGPRRAPPAQPGLAAAYPQPAGELLADKPRRAPQLPRGGWHPQGTLRCAGLGCAVLGCAVLGCASLRGLVGLSGSRAVGKGRSAQAPIVHYLLPAFGCRRALTNHFASPCAIATLSRRRTGGRAWVSCCLVQSSTRAPVSRRVHIVRVKFGLGIGSRRPYSSNM